MESDLAETLLQAPEYLQAAINHFIKEHDEEPKPFIWKADSDDIIATIGRGHRMLEQTTSARRIALDL
ncbi:hypothetical protein [Rhizobium leguminosarum]|uniref:hypothetical protein n=1 Tax=Rhizobium leguminosarum TaxID=384 RepID=UPI003D7C190F